jgi:Protein of unknown function (DUF992)
MRSHRLRRYLLLTIFVAATLGLGPGVRAQTWVQAGMLKCRLNPSIGFVIFGHQSMECSFQPVSGPAQVYEGAINTVGLDLGFSEGGVLAWGVFGPAKGDALRRARRRVRRGFRRSWFWTRGRCERFNRWLKS